MLVNKWWNIYNDVSLDYKVDDVGEATDLLDAALSKAAGAVKFIPAPSAA
jgi:hypothetical protein